MTVSRHRRRLSTTWAIAASIAGVSIAAALGLAGYVAIAHTTDGQVVGGDTPEVTFPATPTATIAVVDEDGNLASVAVLTGRPGDDDERRGGTVVPVPISADSSGGFGTERTPINETVELFGAETLADEVPMLLGVGIDELIVVDEDGLADLLAPIGAVEVDLPVAVTDATGRQVAAAGPQTLAADQLAEIFSAADPNVTGADRYPIDVALWGAIADVVGDGLATPLTTAPDPPTSDPDAEGAAPDDIVSAVTSGPISVQPLRSSPIVSLDRNPRGVDAAALDRPEVLVIFGHIAPSKVAAPNPGYNFRVVSPFADDQLGGAATRLDVAYTATAALLGADANVISVDTSAGEADTMTMIDVNDENLVAAAQTLAEVFGPVEVRVADTRIAGIDVVATLGTEYLNRLDAAAAETETSVGTTG
jgi:LytR_cpsA_psr family